MKYPAVISSLSMLFLGFMLLNLFNSWQFKEKASPEIRKSSPVKNIPGKNEVEKIKIDTIHLIPKDSLKIIPIEAVSDTTGAAIKDTTRSTQQIDRKPDIRYYRRINQYNLHRKLPVT